MEQTMNRDEGEAEGRASWRSVGALASGWADRVATVRLARGVGEAPGEVAARLGLAAE